MKKQYVNFLMKSAFGLAIFLTAGTTFAQVELKLLTEMGSRFNDVNDSGIGIMGGGYYDFATEVLTPMEAESTGLSAINNEGTVAGQMFFDEPNFIMQPAYKLNDVWTPIGWFPDAIPAESSFTTYDISSNGKYIVGQMSKGCCDFGTFLYDTETGTLTDLFDPNGEALAGYSVNDAGIIGGWLDQPNGGGTLRVPAYFTADGTITLIPDGQLPTLNTNAINDINNSNVMVGDFDGQPFIYDQANDVFTLMTLPDGAMSATFGSISENGIAIGYADVDFQVREAIVYHPSLGPDPLYLVDVLAGFGITIDTPDGMLGTAYKISDDGNFVAGWVNGPPMFAEGWMVNFDDLLLLGAPEFEESTLSYYPNPVETVLNIDNTQPISTVAVFNVLGQNILNLSPNSNHVAVNTSGFPAGVYFFKTVVNGKTNQFKIVKK